MSKIQMDWNNQPCRATFDGRIIQFKSKLEMRWAKYLDLLKRSGHIKDWAYEPMTFIFPNETQAPVRYKPDFKVIENNGDVTIYECKGFLTGRDVSKFRKVQKHYPETKLVLVMAQKDKSTKRVNRYASALKYVERIIYANSIFRQAGIK